MSGTVEIPSAIGVAGSCARPEPRERAVINGVVFAAAAIAPGRQSHRTPGLCGQVVRGRPARRTGIIGRSPSWLQEPERWPRMQGQLMDQSDVKRRVPGKGKSEGSGHSPGHFLPIDDGHSLCKRFSRCKDVETPKAKPEFRAAGAKRQKPGGPSPCERGGLGHA